MQINEIKSKHATIIIVLFHLILVLPMALMGFSVGSEKDKEFKKREGRSRNKLPVVQNFYQDVLEEKTKFNEFTGGFESWFNDRYYGRDPYLDINGWIYQKLKASYNPNQYMYGYDDYIFLGDSYKEINSRYYGVKEPSRREYLEYLYARRVEQEYIQSLNIRYLLVVAPDKQSIYPEKMNPNPKINKTPVDTLLFYNEKFKSNIKLLNLKDDLLEAKKTYKDYLYYKQDTHWSDLGAYIAYNTIIDEMESMLGYELNKLSLKEYTIHSFEVDRDMNRVARLTASTPDSDFNIKNIYEQGFHELDAIDFKGKHKNWPKYKTIPRVTNLIIKNEKALNQLTVIVLRDSFYTAMSPMFNQTFSTVIVVGRRSYEERHVINLLHKHRPDFVIVEHVERNTFGPLHVSKEMEAHFWKSLTRQKRPLFSIEKAGKEIINKNSSIGEQDLTFSGNILQIDAQGNNPRFIFSVKELSLTNFLVKMSIEADTDTRLALLYRGVNDAGFSDEKVEIRDIKSGYNELYIPISDENMIQALRLDPGQKPGVYKIKTLELYEYDPKVLGASD